jgi:hypothetical protein
MKYTLTHKYQFSKKCKDGHRRNFLIYFLNDIQILKQKVPFDETYRVGYDCKTQILDEFLLNGSIHQMRINGQQYVSDEEFQNIQRSISLSEILDNVKKKKFSTKVSYWGDITKTLKIRTVRFPVSKKVLKELQVPNDLTIELTKL